MRSQPAMGRAGLSLAAVLMAASIAAGPVHAQQSGDLGIMVRRLVIESYSAECVAVHPDIEAQLQRDREQWLAANASELQRADAQFATLPEDRKAALASLLANLAEQTQSQVAVVHGSGQSREFCGQIVATFGTVSESGSLDAKGYDEARGMYWMLMLTVRETATQCGAQFPALSWSIGEAQTAWRTRDDKVIATVEAFLRANADEPMVSELEAVGVRSARSNFDTAHHAGLAEPYCQKYFNDLAAGAARDKTPQMYAFLENGPTTD